MSGHHLNRTQEPKSDNENIKNAERVDEELDDSVDYVINELGFLISYNNTKKILNKEILRTPSVGNSKWTKISIGIKNKISD